MDARTDDYCALYIDNRAITNNLEDCIKYYKVDLKRFPMIETGEWTFGATAYHDFSKARKI